EDAAADAAKMQKGALHIVEEDAPHDLNVFLRGNVDNKGPLVPRRFLEVLSEGEPVPFKQGSGRKELAEAIASPRNPLTAREMVLSATYRQSSARTSPGAVRRSTPTHPYTRTPTHGAAPNALDPENRLLWRMNRRRLTVEQWRDSALQVSGLLEAGGGPSQE